MHNHPPAESTSTTQERAPARSYPYKSKGQQHISEAFQQRFGGIARLYGESALLDLQLAHFAVIGVGGVGTWVAEALARSGVGEITLVDLDDICITNSNRQIHALQSTIGRQKTQVLAERLRDINPEIIVHEVEDFLDGDNMEEVILTSMDFVIDAIDAGQVKAKLIAHCRRHKQLMLTIGSAGGKVDPMKITHCDLSRTTNDPLLAKVRNSLRRLHGFPRNPKRYFSIEAIYSVEQMRYPDTEGGVCSSKANLDGGVKLDCSGGFGAATMVTASFGLVAVSRAIQKYLDKCLRQRQIN